MSAFLACQLLLYFPALKRMPDAHHKVLRFAFLIVFFGRLQIQIWERSHKKTAETL
jgi:hypothetical protein